MSKDREPAAGHEPAPQGEELTPMKSPWKIVLGFAVLLVLLCVLAFFQGRA